jgi:hypothetical protein
MNLLGHGRLTPSRTRLSSSDGSALVATDAAPPRQSPAFLSSAGRRKRNRATMLQSGRNARHDLMRLLPYLQTEIFGRVACVGTSSAKRAGSGSTISPAWPASWQLTGFDPQRSPVTVGFRASQTCESSPFSRLRSSGACLEVASRNTLGAQAPSRPWRGPSAER